MGRLEEEEMMMRYFEKLGLQGLGAQLGVKSKGERVIRDGLGVDLTMGLCHYHLEREAKGHLWG